ncbi:MAG TPA: DNA repair protein RadC [Elusimicrobiota bacterium]|nr:DNA repair protein RadC [Elusimicrobiota bacterium]
MKMSAFDKLHRIEKPREKLARGGAGALKDEELLAILLRTGYKGKDVLALSHEVTKKFPGKKLFELTFEELSAIKGIGETRAATLLAAWELAKRQLDPAGGKPVIQTPEDVCNQVTEIRARKKEHFVVLYLNTRNQLLHREFVSIGTLNASLVHPREVFEPAVRCSAAAVVLVHNHPSGDCAPSEEDRALTRRIQEAGRLLGIDVLDHVIVAENSRYSFEESGRL